MALHVFALTGGIGSGKSTVAKFWRSEGLAVVDADGLAREVVTPGAPALEEIAREFGSDVLDEQGALQRARLGEIVFGDAAARQRLERIVHPRVRAAAAAHWEDLAAAGRRLACYEVPLLFETGQEEAYRPVVVVQVSPATQLERIMARDGLERAAAQARIDAQMPLAEKAARADYVISNDGPLEETLRSARAVLDAIERRCG
jgi:dephospho-CoA kinase